MSEIDQKTTKKDAAAGITVDENEVAFFARIADSWWDPHGPFRPLHILNPTRLGYIREQVESHFGAPKDSTTPYKGLRFLDIGCGGGLVSEPVARLGADMVSVDASEKNIKTASLHAANAGLKIDFRNTTAESLVDLGEQFDVIINMEVVEHVADVDAFLTACAALLKPGGLMLMSTINRTVKAYLFAIIGAEHVLRWLPVGAHDWNKFLKPAELANALKKTGLTHTAPTGFVMNPLTQKWRLDDRDVAVNYAMAARKVV
ncbi:bifunctional 2-polyprenyl-6-hydroxyphenol methylase/3-demethylubiquinol 3-O-methyltransferase UbiG [Kordiimonas pumila]|uniref:Ubiquinone biosynthesis O-methyltransferase n=1 Tax=Kordiimonas pumila TaxID=2161677 RepID=A0ABV7D1L9_9PROT|nr:bifunctional 2-polyprenyl-6-hydroxyphenol methylase/3-demethylubiquinol 3-O-methyltransferase UbiG [Kordiimonas pumila]